MDQLDLSDFFTTRAQANDFVTRLSSISEKIYQTRFNLEKALIDQFGIEKKDKFLTMLRENNIDVGSNSALKEFFAKLQEKASSLPTLSLTIAFEPKEKTLKEVSEWFVMNLKKQVLFDIKVDPDLLAGAAISFNGKYFDFSVKTKFDRILQEALQGKQEKPVVQKSLHQRTEDMTLGR